MGKQTRKRTTLVAAPEDHVVAHPAKRPRVLLRSDTARVRAANRALLLETISGPVFSSGYLRWYEAENFGQITKGCRAVWNEQKENYRDWTTLLRELNSKNGTNRCRHCAQDIVLRANRQCCTLDRWNTESAKRTPDFHGIVDLLLTSAFLTWREKGTIDQTSKRCYAIHKQQCTCCMSKQSTHGLPFMGHDPRYADDYDTLTDFRKCQAVATYTSWLIRNLHAFYSFDGVTDPSRLPRGLEEWTWLDTQMVTLQRGCPSRYAFAMNVVSLYIAHEELQRSPPIWFAAAFLGQRYDPSQAPSFQEFLGAGISEFCLPATDEVLAKFLRKKCYPSAERQKVLGPAMARRMSIFSPFMDMVSIDESTRLRLPRSLERMTSEVIEAMNTHFFCTIS